MRRDPKITRLAGVPLFADVDPRHLERIARICTESTVPAGTVLCREGEIGREFFVIQEGTAAVSVGGTTLATLSAGDFFGELALLDGQERNATVTAATEMQVLVLTNSEFSALLHEEPMVAVRMLPTIGARLRDAVHAGAHHPTAV